jgi:hypothetical protein
MRPPMRMMGLRPASGGLGLVSSVVSVDIFNSVMVLLLLKLGPELPKLPQLRKFVSLAEEADELVFEAGEPDGQVGRDQGVEFGQGAVEHEDGHEDEEDAAE